MSLKKIICFLTLADEDVLAECDNTFDKYVIYASFGRQVLSSIFSLCVLFYGFLLVLPWWQSLIISVLVSGILLMIDQSIIGSEWQMNYKEEYFDNRILQQTLGSLINFLIKVVKFLPRIIYSLFLSVALATLAEISLQAGAIDKVLQQETSEKNKSYFEDKKTKEGSLNTAITAQREKVNKLEEQINSRLLLGANINSEQLQKKQRELNSDLEAYKAKLRSVNSNYDVNIKKRNNLQVQVNRLKNDIKNKEETARKEATDINRGASCDRRCTERKREAIIFEDTLGEKNPELIEVIETIGYIEEEKALLESKIKNVEKSISINRDSLLSLNQSNKSTEDIQKEHESELEKLEKMISDKSNEITRWENEQKMGGNFNLAKYDLLDRFIGLDKLHKHEVKGEAAQKFSLGVKLFFILLEFSAVLVMLFFSPLTSYSEKMRRKHLIEIERNESQTRGFMKQSAFSNVEKDLASEVNHLESVKDYLDRIGACKEDVINGIGERSGLLDMIKTVFYEWNKKKGGEK